VKHLILILVVLAGIWLGFVALKADPPTYDGAAGEVPAHLSGELPAGFRVASFEVEGMCCSTCPGKLYASLSGVEGVREAAVDFDTSTAEAVVPEALPDEALLAVLNVDKYTARPRP
jgi:copper chaperone CopZ